MSSAPSRPILEALAKRRGGRGLPRLPPVGARAAWAASAALVLIALIATMRLQRRAEHARRQWGETAAVWVLAAPQPAGHALTAADLRAERRPVATLPAGAVPAGRDLRGETLRAAVVAGEVLVGERLGGALTVLELDPATVILPRRAPPTGAAVALLSAEDGIVIEATVIETSPVTAGAVELGAVEAGATVWRVAVAQRDAPRVAAGMARRSLVVGLVSAPRPPTG